MCPQAPLRVVGGPEHEGKDQLREPEGCQRIGGGLVVRNAAATGGEAGELDQRHELRRGQAETEQRGRADHARHGDKAGADAAWAT